MKADRLYYDNLTDLLRNVEIPLPPARLAKWRWVFPNTGTLRGLEHLGTVAILCTDGCEAYFHVGGDQVLHGHLKNFIGPVTKEYVWEQDWDWEKNRRKVSVFRRHDGTYAIIPRDKEKEEYWSKHSKYTQDEKDLFDRIGQMLGHDNEQALELLKNFGSIVVQARSEPKPKRQSKSRQREILATL